MRYRIKNYSVSIQDNIVILNFSVPEGIVIKGDPNNGSTNISSAIFIKESIRLIINETNKVVLCSSMQKDSIIDVYGHIDQGESTASSIYIKIAIPDGKTFKHSDNFTIEMDWGDIAETHEQATANKNEIIAQIQANAGIPTLTIPDTTAEQILAPNVLYIFSTRTSTLTLTLGTPIVGIANEYHFFIECGETAPTINFPSGITWNGESVPIIEANKKYEVSILNNIAIYLEV